MSFCPNYRSGHWIFYSEGLFMVLSLSSQSQQTLKWMEEHMYTKCNKRIVLLTKRRSKCQTFFYLVQCGVLLYHQAFSCQFPNKL